MVQVLTSEEQKDRDRKQKSKREYYNGRTMELGMHHLTAVQAQRRRLLLLKYFPQKGHVGCHKCGKEFNHFREISIGHKHYPFAESFESAYGMENAALYCYDCNPEYQFNEKKGLFIRVKTKAVHTLTDEQKKWMSIGRGSKVIRGDRFEPVEDAIIEGGECIVSFDRKIDWWEKYLLFQHTQEIGDSICCLCLQPIDNVSELALKQMPYLYTKKAHLAFFNIHTTMYAHENCAACRNAPSSNPIVTPAELDNDFWYDIIGKQIPRFDSPLLGMMGEEAGEYIPPEYLEEDLCVANDEDFDEVTKLYENVASAMGEEALIRRVILLEESDFNKVRFRMKDSSRTYYRDPHLAALVKIFANGFCQDTGSSCTVKRKNEIRNISESHHVEWLENGGADRMFNLISVSPNSHATYHKFGQDDRFEELKALGVKNQELLEEKAKELGIS